MESLRLQGIEVKSFASQLLVEPMFLRNQSHQPYKVFTPFYKAILGKNIPTPKPNPLHGKTFQPTAINSIALDDFNLLPSIPWHKEFFSVTNFTRTDALNKIASLKQHKLEDYSGMRDIPGHDGTSLLSWALRLGVIGVKELWHALEPDSHSSVYLRQLVWREFSWHLLFHFPKTATEPLNERFKAWPYLKDKHLLKSWQQGKTGVPIVDAGMRQLWKTGYMHNRVRMICASYLTKNLNISWVDGEKWFYDTLIDADEANNVMGWQWVAGCGADAAPYFRIFNPVLQSMKFDPEGAYLLKWLPELAGLKGKALHQPWLQPDFNYPKPLVCLDTSRKMALQLYQNG
jgi:deoxyribodipyrimidine photo-lyase